ncbi:MAG TPA: SLC13 family permease, partial [Pirellulales bacterium]
MTDSIAIAEPQIVKRIGFFAGPLALLLLGLSASPNAWLALDPAQPKLNLMAGVLALMCIWWTTEAVPMGATALVPLALCPLLGLTTLKDLQPAYGDSNIFLYLGGFLVALAVEECGLHRRMALGVVSVVGGRPHAIVGGVMFVTATLSMWMSNTATALLMLPLASSVLVRFDEQTRRTGPSPRSRNLGLCLMLGIAYAASIGGIATLVGTPPNTFMSGFFKEALPNEPELSFFGWMRMAVPLSYTMLLAAWVLLAWVIFPPDATPAANGFEEIAEQRRALGPMHADEWRVLCVFVTLALAWTFREPFKGWGWGPALGLDKTRIDDAGVAVIAGIAC